MQFTSQQKEELAMFFAPKADIGKVLPDPKSVRDLSFFTLIDGTSRLLYQVEQGQWIFLAVATATQPQNFSFGGKTILGIPSSVAPNGTVKTFPKPSGGLLGSYRVYAGNVRLKPGDDYSEDNYNVYLTIPPQSGDTVWFDYDK